MNFAAVILNSIAIFGVIISATLLPPANVRPLTTPTPECPKDYPYSLCCYPGARFVSQQDIQKAFPGITKPSYVPDQLVNLYSGCLMATTETTDKSCKYMIHQFASMCCAHVEENGQVLHDGIYCQNNY